MPRYSVVNQTVRQKGAAIRPTVYVQNIPNISEYSHNNLLHSSANGVLCVVQEDPLK